MRTIHSSHPPWWNSSTLLLHSRGQAREIQAAWRQRMWKSSTSMDKIHSSQLPRSMETTSKLLDCDPCESPSTSTNFIHSFSHLPRSGEHTSRRPGWGRYESHRPWWTSSSVSSRCWGNTSQCGNEFHPHFLLPCGDMGLQIRLHDSSSGQFLSTLWSKLQGVLSLEIGGDCSSKAIGSLIACIDFSCCLAGIVGDSPCSFILRSSRGLWSEYGVSAFLRLARGLDS